MRDIQNLGIVGTINSEVFKHIQGYSEILSHAQAYWGTLKHIKAYSGIIEAYLAVLRHIQNSG